MYRVPAAHPPATIPRSAHCCLIGGSLVLLWSTSLPWHRTMTTTQRGLEVWGHLLGYTYPWGQIVLGWTILGLLAWRIAIRWPGWRTPLRRLMLGIGIPLVGCAILVTMIEGWLLTAGMVVLGLALVWWAWHHCRPA